ncbi:hypothetical protein, partial [Bradyrhizobium sp.]|uniref:hypothetical protein n=1 Tax=Bradyrhizobium sp. TaxID=376 RepID=UPI003C1AF34A
PSNSNTYRKSPFEKTKLKRLFKRFFLSRASSTGKLSKPAAIWSHGGDTHVYCGLKPTFRRQGFSRTRTFYTLAVDFDYAAGEDRGRAAT